MVTISERELNELRQEREELAVLMTKRNVQLQMAYADLRQLATEVTAPEIDTMSERRLRLIYKNAIDFAQSAMDRVDKMEKQPLVSDG